MHTHETIEQAQAAIRPDRKIRHLSNCPLAAYYLYHVHNDTEHIISLFTTAWKTFQYVSFGFVCLTSHNPS